MIRGFLLILDAGGSWEKIARAQRGFFFILLAHLLPLLVIPAGVEAYAMTRLGEGRTIAGDAIVVTPEMALRYVAACAALGLAVVLGAAKIVEWISRSSHFATSFRICFTLVAYGLSPLFLLHLLDALPGVNTWVCFGIGLALSIGVLYLGVPNVLRPDPAKAMGLYLTVAVILLGLCGLAHFVALGVLHNELNLRFWEAFVR
jgi:hypothetical protein